MFFRQIDWLLIKGYFRSYVICLVSLLSLYVVVDLFMHLDDFFAGNKSGLGVVAYRIGTYYAYRIPQLFDRLCEAIVLLAGMFTVAMMQRNNEHLPLLSTGVPTQRVVAPILCCAFFMIGLQIANQELVIPRIASKLALDRNDPDGDRDIIVRSDFEPNDVLLEGDKAKRSRSTPGGGTVRKFRCVIPESVDGDLIHITAEEAIYRPGGGAAAGGPAGGGETLCGTWEMIGCTPADVAPIEGVLEVHDKGRYVLHVRAVDFEALTRDQKWFQLARTDQLYRELQRPESRGLVPMAVLFHVRLTRPLLGMVLVLMGLSVILRDTNRNVIISSGLCVVLCAVFFVTCNVTKMMGDNGYLSPAMAAWLPVVAFGPFGVVMFDAVQT
jgi:lipopolysaccharide export system permease protein